MAGKNKEIFNVFFREKPAMMLVELRNAKTEVYASSLAKQIDCTYSHVVKILQEMEKAKNEIENIKGILIMLTKYVSVLTFIVTAGIILASPLLQSTLKIDNVYLIILTSLTFASFNPPAILMSAFDPFRTFAPGATA